MLLSLGEIQPGAAILHRGEPWLVVDRAFHQKDKSPGILNATLKNLASGKTEKVTWRGADKVDEADIERRSAQFLYKNGEDFAFMDEENFDQFEIPESVIGTPAKFLKDGMTVQGVFWDGRAVAIQLPVKVIFEIAEAEPGVKGDSATGKLKNAVLENGVAVQVPLFVEAGNRIVVDTRDGSYVERA